MIQLLRLNMHLTLAALAFLSAVGLGNFFTTASSRVEKNDDLSKSARNSNITSGIICLFAAFMYISMKNSTLNVDVGILRSIDWLITCPLLLIEMAFLLGTSLKNKFVWIAILASILNGDCRMGCK